MWKDAIESYQSNLTASQYQKLRAIGSFDNLRDELAKGQAAYRKRTIPRLLARLDPFFKQLKFFSEAISILVSSNPEIAALVWGSIYMVLEVSIGISMAFPSPHRDAYQYGARHTCTVTPSNT